MTLAQLGADVIRIDPLGGGLDFGRWPVTPDGYSLYWAGLNKGKKSVTVDVRSERGQDLIRRLVTARGGPGGILISNLSPKWLGYEILKELREDVIVVSLLGNPDGSIAVDYTVNAAAGFPQITGNGDGPVNHVLPAWDVAAGNQVALSVLAALLHRNRTGEGQYVELSLADVAFSIVGHLGFIGEAVVNDEDRQANGNYVKGLASQRGKRSRRSSHRGSPPGRSNGFDRSSMPIGSVGGLTSLSGNWPSETPEFVTIRSLRKSSNPALADIRRRALRRSSAPSGACPYDQPLHWGNTLCQY
jgi:CoA-transferase family III